MSFFKAMAAGMFLIGIGTSVVSWNAGERGFFVFVWPFALGGTMLVVAVVGDLLYPKKHSVPKAYAFPQPDGTPSTSEPLIADDLGAELFRCRPLGFWEFQTNQGTTLFILFAMPLLILPALAVIAAMMIPSALIVVNVLMGHSADALKQSWWWHSLIGISFGVIYMTVLWFLWLAPLITPLRDRLIVHANGFRLKCGKADVGVRFTDLLEINFGRELKNTPEGAPREVARDGMFILNSAMNLQLRSGRTVPVKGLLRRFDQHDLERFLDHVEAHHPALFLERAYLTDTPAGAKFMITESRWKSRQPGVPHPRSKPEQPLEQLRDVLTNLGERSPLRFSPKANPIAATLVACGVIVFALFFIAGAIDGMVSGSVWMGSKSSTSHLVYRDDAPIAFWIAIALHLASGAAFAYAGVAELLYRLNRLPAAKPAPVRAQSDPQGQCPKCHADVLAHDNLHHCVYCGSNQLDAASAAAPVHCRGCGSYLKTAAKSDDHFAGHISFCGHCGFKLPP